MAVITDYATLQTAVGDWLARSDLSSFIPNFVQNFEEDFYREPLNWAAWMEADLSVSISSGEAATPSDYLGLKIAYISGQTSPPLKRISLDQLYQRYPRAVSGNQAVYVARNGDHLEFGPNVSSGTLVGTYYAKPTLLRSDSDGINWLITNAPDICLYGALLAATPFLQNDKRLAVWQTMYDRALNSYRNQFKEEDYSGSPPHTVTV
jgi:hypothetical protein